MATIEVIANQLAIQYRDLDYRGKNDAILTFLEQYVLSTYGVDKFADTGIIDWSEAITPDLKSAKTLKLVDNKYTIDKLMIYILGGYIYE